MVRHKVGGERGGMGLILNIEIVESGAIFLKENKERGGWGLINISRMARRRRCVGKISSRIES